MPNYLISSLFLIFAFSLSARTIKAQPHPEVEVIGLGHKPVVIPVQNEAVSKTELLIAASSLFKKALSKTSFNDLVVDETEETFSDAGGMAGYKSYSLKLSDDSQNQFEGLIELRFKVEPFVNPRTGDAAYAIHAFCQNLNIGISSTARCGKLLNSKNQVIVEIKN